jgi:hypothetical protein
MLLLLLLLLLMRQGLLLLLLNVLHVWAAAAVHRREVGSRRSMAGEASVSVREVMVEVTAGTKIETI